MDKSYYKLEDIIVEVKKQNFSESKTFNRNFLDILAGMGVSAANITTETGRYKFSEKGFNFWTNALIHYKEPPFSDLRKRNVDAVPLDFVWEFCEMIVETMQNVGKSSHEIRVVCAKIDQVFGYTWRRCQADCRKIMEEEIINKYIEMLNQYHFLTFEDRLIIFDYMKNKLLKPKLNEIISTTSDIVEYFDDERSNEIFPDTVPTDVQLPSQILCADELADAAIANDPEIKEATSQITSSGKFETKSQNSRANRKAEMIEKKKKKHQKAADEQCGISAEQRHSYPASYLHRSAKEILKEAVDDLHEKQA